MSRHDIIAPNSRSWRDIPQEVKPRAMSSGGRRRLVWSVFKTVSAVTIVGALAWGGYELAGTLRGKPATFSGTAEAVPLRQIDLATDGVLTKDWVVRTLALPKNATLMGLDLFALQGRLMASGQVKTATLTREFPDTLVVGLSEQSPLVRVKAKAAEEEAHVFLVARDGTVFDGFGFDPEMLGTLPWLDGVKLTRKGDGFLPVAGMPKVADLVAKAKLEAEHLYRTWQIVSLARLDSDGEIEVRTSEIERISFGTHEDFYRQLARLDALIDTAKANTDRPLREVNLAIGGQVPVVFGEPVAAPAPGSDARVTLPAAVAKSPVLPAFPNLQRKTKL